MQCAWEQNSQYCIFISINRPQFHIPPSPLPCHPPRVSHVPHPPHQDQSLDLAIPFPPFYRRLAVHLTLANDLHVFLSWTSMKTLTTCRHGSFFRICFSLCAVEITFIGIMT